jgi:1-acyl-sn-glycerol-3-phosphate acyltransferase
VTTNVSQKPLTTPSARLLKYFTRYTQHYLKRHFHAVRLAQGADPPDVAAPLVVYLNHPAWWDPLIGLLLASERLPQRRHWAVIEQAQLTRYRIFAKLGFFGVEPGPRGGQRLLAAADQLASEPQGTLWLTPQGRFSDPRERPLQLAPGLGHLAQRLEHAWFLPLALEYAFWEERLPEALARFGEPFCPAQGPKLRAADYTALLSERLMAAQDALAAQSQARSSAVFDNLLEGRAGVGGIYDIWRRSRAWLQGQRFHAAHGSEFNHTKSTSKAESQRQQDH